MGRVFGKGNHTGRDSVEQAKVVEAIAWGGGGGGVV